MISELSRGAACTKLPFLGIRVPVFSRFGCSEPKRTCLSRLIQRNQLPGLGDNPWVEKRSLIKRHGLGFLVLFNGRLHSQLQSGEATALGRQDGNSAVDSAIWKNFPETTASFGTKKKTADC